MGILDLFKRRKPGSEVLHFELRESAALLQKATPLARIAVGHAINMANSMFLTRFVSVDQFLSSPRATQLDYVKSLTATVKSLLHKMLIQLLA